MNFFITRARHRLRPLAVVVLLGTALTVGLAPARPVQAGSAGSHTAATDTLVVAVPSDLQNLDPTLSSADVYTQEMLTNIYAWLIDYKVENKGGQLLGNPNQFVGGLAQSWDVLNHGTVIRFHLRPNAKFSNGDPVNADAVKFTYDRIYDQNGVTPFLLSMAAVPKKDHVVKVDNLTVDFHVDTPNTLLFGNMAQFGHSILDPNVVKPHMTKSDPYAHTWLSTHTTGTETGPYVLQSWQPGSQWVLAANPNYYGSQPKIKKIIFKIIPDASTRLALL